MLKRFLPFLQWFQAVNATTIRADLQAGLTGAVIVLPQGVAFATIAGLPPEYGLYSAIIPTIIAALFGSSLHLISGPTTAISIIIFAKVGTLAQPLTPEYIQLVLTLTFMAGLMQLGLGLARLGAVVNFVSHPVVVGFTAGAAILIVTSQLSHFFGLSLLPKGHSFIRVWQSLFAHLNMTNLHVLSIGLFTLVVTLLLKAYLPKLPGMLIALVGGSALAFLLDAQTHNIPLVGALPASLPPLSYPDITLATLRNLIPDALAIAMLGLAEAVSIARSVAARSHQTIDNNQEFIGQGLSNIVGSFFSSYAASGSFTRTGVNFEAGARTPLSAIIASITLAAILLLIAPLTAYLPMAAMAGVILYVAYNLIDIHHIRSIYNTSRSEAAVMATTFLTTLFVELEFAIFSGVLLSLLLYLNRTSHPHFITLAPDPDTGRRTLINANTKHLPQCPQLRIVRLDGSIFFGAVNHISEELHNLISDDPEQCHILLIGSGINFVDVGGCEMLLNENHTMSMTGRQIYLCSLKKEVLNFLHLCGCASRICPQNIFRTKTEAIRNIIPRLDPERCQTCTKRVFDECQLMPSPD